MNKHRPHGRTAAAAVALLAMTIGAGTSVAGEEPASGAAEGGTFTNLIAADPGKLDPHMSVFNTTLNASAYAYDTLLYQSFDGEIVSGLAESWEETPTSVTYTLKEGITCSDGSELTATTVADNFRFVADPANRSPQLGVFVPPGITAEADDAARTVTISSEQPVPFLLRMTGLGLFIVCADGLADRTMLEDGTAGTGPFVLEEAVPNDHYTYRVREGYAWGPNGATSEDPGFPSEVVLSVVESESTAANLIISGDANAATFTGPDRERLAAEGLFSVEGQAIIGEFMFNHTEGLPTADVAVRQALMRALDLEELMAVQTGGTGVLAEGLVAILPQVCPGNTLGDILTAGADIDEANRLLDEAGWVLDGDVRTKDGEPLRLRAIYVTNFDTNALTMELVLEQWQQLGVEVELQGVDQAQFNTLAFETGAWDVFLSALNVNVPSQLVPFVSGPVPPEGVNFSAIANPEYDQAVAEASALTGEEACAAWNAAEEALFAQMNILPFSLSTLPTFGTGAEFEVGQFGIIGATVRLTDA